MRRGTVRSSRSTSSRTSIVRTRSETDRMRRRLAVPMLAIAVVAVACSSQVRGKIELTQQQSASYMNGGTSTVEGQVSVQPASGPIQYASSNDVRIMPMTTESDDYVQTVVLAGDTKLPGNTFRTPS